MLTLPAYVLVTPARDEAEFIELTIKSVVSQTVLPLKWVIVSDGSTDGTNDIVSKYVGGYPWIELIRMPQRHDRHFAGKVNAFNAGWAAVKGLSYDIIGNLDADVSFDADYFEFLLQRFAEIPQLGVGGTPFREGSFQYDYRFTSVEHVSGQCQLFRKECFEDIGGYIPREIGGVDLVAVITARMKGWQTKTFLEKQYMHQRRMGTASAHFLMAPLKIGRTDRILGSHPVWEVARSAYQTTRRPIIVGGLFRCLGYLWEMVKGTKMQVPTDFVDFRRKEQMQRLRMFLTGRRSDGGTRHFAESAASGRQR